MSRHDDRRGFTLVEMAVVVVIAGIILTALLPALLDVQRSGRLTATQTNLQTLLRATAAYVLANGCLPCPTPGDKIFSAGVGKIGGNNTAPACGVCAQADGIVPYAAIGIDPQTAKDGWGRWITLHIDPALANPQVCSSEDSAAAVKGCGTSDASRSGLCREGAARISPLTIATLPAGSQMQASVILISHGANGYGAYRTQRDGTSITANMRLPFVSKTECRLRTQELTNIKSGGTINDSKFFIDTPGECFDDIISYADRNALVSLLGGAACMTPW